jgi:alpha-L-rhamnosidase
LTTASTRYDSIRGPIATSWTHTEGWFNLDVSIPANTAAAVVLPAADPSVITEGGRPLANAPGVSGVQVDGGRTRLSIDSGSYRFVVKLPVKPSAKRTKADREKAETKSGAKAKVKPKAD